MTASLTTDRLTLRLPQPSDFAPFVATMTPDRLTYLHDAAPDRAQAARILAQMAGTWHLRGTGPAIWELDGTPIGHGGLFWPLDQDAPELGWVLWRKADQGHGYATEAMTALITDAASRCDLSGLWAGIHPDNHRSHRLAKRLGLSPTGDTRDDGDLLYRSTP